MRRCNAFAPWRSLCGGLGVLVLALLPFLSCFSSAGAAVVEQVLVVIDGDPHTLSDFKNYAKKQLGRVFPAGDLNALGKEDQEVIEQYITDKLVASEIKQAGIKVADEDINNYIDQVKEKNHISEEQLKQALAADGLSWEKYRSSIRSEMEKSELVDVQVRKRINITSEDVEKYYSLNQKKYVSEQRVRLRHIMLAIAEGDKAAEAAAAKKTADIRRRLAAGEDFAALAEAYSEGAGASEGGDIGWITKGTLLKEIDQVAFSLNVGEVSSPVRTSAGIHFIKLEAREGGKQLALADIRDKVREEVMAKALEERFQKWMKSDLRRKHRVEVKLAGVVFRPEDNKQDTMDTLVASGAKRTDESSFWDFLNPFKKAPTADVDEGGKPSRLAGQKVISLFGTPLFRTESPDDSDQVDEILAPIENPQAAPPADKPTESPGFWGRLNPFSK
jgi:peptidyl-prolyl cis-trans isomerase SurA